MRTSAQRRSTGLELVPALAFNGKRIIFRNQQSNEWKITIGYASKRERD
jgi:hypothetical protein